MAWPSVRLRLPSAVERAGTLPKGNLERIEAHLGSDGLPSWKSLSSRTSRLLSLATAWACEGEGG